MHAHHTIKNAMMIIQGLIRTRHGAEEVKVYEKYFKDIVVALDYCDCPKRENPAKDEL